jgi:hypothetical protein
MVVVVRDEVILVATNTFIAEQGASGEAAKDLDNDIVCEAGQYVPIVGASSISSVMRSLKRNNPTKIQQ